MVVSVAIFTLAINVKKLPPNSNSTSTIFVSTGHHFRNHAADSSTTDRINLISKHCNSIVFPYSTSSFLNLEGSIHGVEFFWCVSSSDPKNLSSPEIVVESDWRYGSETRKTYFSIFRSSFGNSLNHNFSVSKKS